MENIRINIASDFAKELGARYKYEGPNSGEKFLEEILLSKFNEANKGKVKLLIQLDGVRGYPASFVSGSFGKLSIDKGADALLSTIVFESSNPLRTEKIITEIKKPTVKNSQLAK